MECSETGPPFAGTHTIKLCPVCVCVCACDSVRGRQSPRHSRVNFAVQFDVRDLGASNCISTRAADHQLFNDVHSFKRHLACGKESKAMGSAQPTKLYMLSPPRE